VSVFAGSKENLKKPTVKIVGGLSKNTLYLKQYDVVCIMSNDKKPIACTELSPELLRLK